jgi:AraC-like DNA-binding protein/mannose-6-phosphate isomerase-like protein (cupin superfamily)
MDSSRALSTCIRTAGLPADQRVAHWEHELRNHLVGLRCSSHADEGLLAQQKCLDLGALRIGETRSNAHVIERSAELIRHYPRESVFVNVVCQGEAFVYQRGHHTQMRPGDVLVYDARQPYLMGCTGALHLLHIDLPVEHFQSRFARTDLNKPVLRSGAAGAGRLYSATLRRLLDEVMLHGEAGVANGTALRDQVSDLLAALLAGNGGAPGQSALGASHVLAALAYIEAHLPDEALTIQAVADAVGVSPRHLARLFAQQETTVVEAIMRQRLARAHEQLCDARYAEQSISATAYRWGFASHAHFSRAFRAAYDTTPTELRRSRHH